MSAPPMRFQVRQEWTRSALADNAVLEQVVYVGRDDWIAEVLYYGDLSAPMSAAIVVEVARPGRYSTALLLRVVFVRCEQRH